MKNNQSGFTLVEIAIVLVIIGLLLGGVLKGGGEEGFFCALVGVPTRAAQHAEEEARVASTVYRTQFYRTTTTEEAR